MTKRLYFADPYLTHFSAQVVARREHQGQPVVALDQSAFYPEGGGQPADYGTLSDVAVLDVQADDAFVWHTLAAPLSDDLVWGVVDWARRFDHMQQHHGQHLLSAAFERLFGMRTVSFHLGVQLVTIDLDTPSVTQQQANAAADLVNHVIWEDRPILARFVTREELATIALRKPPPDVGQVRVVSVPDFDHSACGGTHPRSTGGVGIVHVRHWERRGAATRVEFLCGVRAAHDYRSRDAILGRLAALLSVGADEVEEAIERLRASEAQNRKRFEHASEQLTTYEARELVAAAPVTPAGRVVCGAYADHDAEQVRALARAVAAAGAIAILGVRGSKAQLIIARGEGLPVDCGALLRTTLAGFGGRGGGQATLAQGGLPDPAMLDAAITAAREALG